MKFIVAAAVFLATAAVNAQSLAPVDTLHRQFTNPYQRIQPSQGPLGLQPERPNEIRVDGTSYDGIFVELYKTGNPLQMINPAAPADYGSSEDNVVWDPITGNATGLKLFSIQF
jgi:hypothetical protein